MTRKLISLAVSAVVALVLLASPASAQITECSDCFWCPGETHIQFENKNVLVQQGQSIPGYVLGHLEDWGCEDAMCDELLPCAYGNNEEQDFVLLAAALGGTKEKAKEYLKKYPGNVEYVAERRAVQLVRCNGAIIAHLPLRQPVKAPTPRIRWTSELRV